MTTSYLNELNQVQHDAVTNINGPVLVIAGPGSGKTRVLTYRIAYMLETGIKPWEIMSLTFTNKAAREMQERIEKVVGDRAKGIWSGTFHSLFSRILRAEATRLGYSQNFIIYDADDSKSILRDLIKTSGLDTKAYPENAVFSAISLAKNNLISPQEYAMNADLMKNDKFMKRPYIHKLYELYVKRCKLNSAMDFDDLLYQTYQLFDKHLDLRAKYATKFRYVLVDEFQDTNALQSAILQKIVNYPGSPNNICVVGDDAQSIYAFRGATIDNILEFNKTYPNLKTFKLEQNYRSTAPIVQAANQLIANNSKQLKKTIFTDKLEGEPIQLVRVLTAEDEARRVASIIIEQKTRAHLTNGDIAILYRTNSQSRLFEEALTAHRIAYRVYGGMSFYQRKEVKDVLSYLRFCINTADSEALKRIINYPKRAIGDATVEKMQAEANKQGITLWEVAKQVHLLQLPARASTSVLDFVKLMELMIQQMDSMPAHDFANYVFRTSGILKELKADTTLEGVGRLENVVSLLDGIKAYIDNTTEDEETSLALYLQNIALITDADKEQSSDDTVKLMSVHAAKGLEFPSVFITGLEEGVFPSGMSNTSPNQREAIDEERRLFYVAITRAKEFLHISYSTSRYRHGKMSYNDPSRFLNEIKIGGDAISSATNTSSARGLLGGPPSPRMQQKYGTSQESELLTPPDGQRFQPTPTGLLKTGHSIFHERFGVGRIQDIQGGLGSQIAVIVFENQVHAEKRIMLKHAKLMLLS